MIPGKISEVPPRRRKALLLLPLVVIPFLTLGFWALGGGRASRQGQEGAQSGLNERLPAPRLPEEEDSKLSFYEVARQDSLKQKERTAAEGFFSRVDTAGQAQPGDRYGLSFGETTAGTQDPAAAEEKVYQRLTELNRQLERPLAAPAPATAGGGTAGGGRLTLPGSDIDRLENLMERLQAPQPRDPQIEQLQGLMDKILDVRYPDRVRERGQQQGSVGDGGVVPVRRIATPVTVSCLDSTDHPLEEPFLGLSEAEQASFPVQPAASLPAVLHGGGSVKEGSVVRLRLLTGTVISGVPLPQNHFVYGTASLSGERLHIRVSSVRYGDRLLPVRLEVCDADGLPGIAVPGSLVREEANRSLGSASQSVGLVTIDPSLKGQVAAGGIGAVKSLLGKKARQQKVYLRNGYRVWLHDRSR